MLKQIIVNIIASIIPFDNSTNGFTSNTVQTAIEEAKLSGGGSTNYQIDGGTPNSVYGSTDPIDGGIA